MSGTSRVAPPRMIWLRHGRTAWNHEVRAQGHAEVPLDDVGLAQAAAVAPLIAALGPTRIVSSDLQRAAQTAAAVAGECGLPVEHEPRLREYAVGVNRMGLTPAEYAERFPEEHAHLMAGRIEMIPGRENDEQVAARFVPAVQAIADAVQPGECVLIVSHGAALRTGLAGFLGWDRAMAGAIAGLDNCGWIELEHSAGTFTGSRAQWRMLAYNRTALRSCLEGGPDFSPRHPAR